MKKSIKKLKVYLALLTATTAFTLVSPEEANAKTHFSFSRVTTEAEDSFDITEYRTVAHQLEKGETMRSVAKKYSTTVEQIAKINDMDVSDIYKLKEGDIIIVSKKESYKKSNEEITAKEDKASLLFRVDREGNAYAKVTNNIKKEKDNFKNTKTYNKLKIGKEYKINGLKGPVVDVANTTIKGKTDYYYFLLSDGTVQMLDMNQLFKNGKLQVTEVIKGFNTVDSLFTVDNKGVITAYASINYDSNKKLPKKADALKVEEKYEVKKDYSKLTIDATGYSVIQFGLTEKGEVVAKLTDNFGKDSYNFENLDVITKLKKGTKDYIYKVDNIKEKVIDIASINSGSTRVSDYVFLLEDGTIQLLDLDAFYKDGKLKATERVKGYDNCMMFLPGEYPNSNVKHFAFVQILDNHNVKDIITYEQYKNLNSPYSYYR
ncbi:MAG TPA: LysM peptidoglycan-binding domain-containing protein [Tenericutes bacterium]|nr:LysM peptidoglycan-binding domain-containing protein [Mycoplasmatota bacterium]